MRNLRKDLTWIGLAYVTYLIVSVLCQIGAAVMTRWLIPVIGESAWLVFCMAAMYPLAFFLYWLILQRVPKAERTWTCRINVGSFLAYFVVCMGGVYLGNLIGQILMAIVSQVTGNPMINQVEEMIENMDMGAVIASAVIMAPVMEELIFRKLILDRLAGYGPAVSILTSGLIFGLAHGNFYQFFYAFFLGMVFAYLYLRTGKVRYSMILHAMVNFCGSVIPMLLLNVTEQSMWMTMLASATQLTVMAAFMIAAVVLLLCKRAEIGNYLRGSTVKGWFWCLITSPGMILLFVCCIFLFFL